MKGKNFISQKIWNFFPGGDAKLQLSRYLFMVSTRTPLYYVLLLRLDDFLLFKGIEYSLKWLSFIEPFKVSWEMMASFLQFFYLHSYVYFQS